LPVGYSAFGAGIISGIAMDSYWGISGDRQTAGDDGGRGAASRQLMLSLNWQPRVYGERG